jgi:peptidoglycan-N-acetylglucosamine deacetylase
MSRYDAPHQVQRSLARCVGFVLLVAATTMAACSGGAHSTSSTALPSAQVISSGDPNRMVVALTFDSANDGLGAPEVLDTLTANGIKATFGVTGRWAELNGDLIRRVVNEGHSIINHSYHHWSFTGASGHNAALSQEVRWNEVDTTEAMVQNLTGATTKPYFRAPFGDDGDTVNQDVYAHGYTYNVRWTVDSWGWKGLDPQAIIQRCLSQAKPGAIYLFHIGTGSRDFEALPAVIDGLRKLGLGFETVPEMIAAGGVQS